MSEPSASPALGSGSAVPPVAGSTAPRVSPGTRASTAWRSRDVLRVTAIVFGFYVVLQLLWFASALVLVSFLGVLFGLAISAGVDRLAVLRVPRAIGAAAIVATFFAFMYGAGAAIAPTVSEQLTVLKSRLPEAQARVERWIQERGGIFGSAIGNRPVVDTIGAGAESTAVPPAQRVPAARAVPDSLASTARAPLSEGLGAQLGSAVRYVFPFLTSTIAGLAGIVVMLFVAIYVAVDPATYRRGFLSLVPVESRATASHVLTEMAVMLRRWLVTQLIAMFVIGVVSTVVLLALRVKAPFALGLVAGLLEFVPTIGPILSAIPAIGMGFLDSPEKAFYVAIAYIVIQQTEGQILIPLLMKGGIDIPPVLTILAQAVMALVFGFIGLMVAVPLLAAIIVPLRILYIDRESTPRPAMGSP